MNERINKKINKCLLEGGSTLGVLWIYGGKGRENIIVFHVYLHEIPQN